MNSDINFDLIKKRCGKEMSFRLQGALNNLKSTTVKVVNTGMVSSGKSSLYNLLTDNATTERFPTGAARTTVIADSYSYKNMEYIDTPGIDVRDADDDVAFRTIMESDIILIIHNIKTGPLTRSESDWISRIANDMKDHEMCKRRMIFVCTWKDTREKDEGYSEILEEVKKMVYDAVGTEIPFFDVSTKKYLDGIKKEKEVLCKNSGVPELKAFIEDFADKYTVAKKEYALEILKKVSVDVCGSLESRRTDNEKKISKQTSDVKQRFNSQRNSWSSVFDYFKSRRDSLSGLEQELSNI